MRAGGHILCVSALLVAFLVLPAWMGGVDAAALVSGDADLVSSATVIQAAPSGHFTILINRDLHTNDEVLGYWVDFFEGKDVPLIFEDVSCVALDGDASGLDMAESLASRLPANQMKVRTEDGTLALSKVAAGAFDIVVMSDEAAQNYAADDVVSLPFVEVVHR